MCTFGNTVIYVDSFPFNGIFQCEPSFLAYDVDRCDFCCIILRYATTSVDGELFLICLLLCSLTYVVVSKYFYLFGGNCMSFDSVSVSVSGKRSTSLTCISTPVAATIFVRRDFLSDSTKGTVREVETKSDSI